MSQTERSETAVNHVLTCRPREHDLANAVRGFLLGNSVEEPSADGNVVGCVFVSRVVPFRIAGERPSSPARAFASGSKNKRSERSDSLARCAVAQRAVWITGA